MGCRGADGRSWRVLGGLAAVPEQGGQPGLRGAPRTALVAQTSRPFSGTSPDLEHHRFRLITNRPIQIRS
jgi:hypothetical protein